MSAPAGRRRPGRAWLAGMAAAAALVTLAACGGGAPSGGANSTPYVSRSLSAQHRAAVNNPALDLGGTMGGKPAPGFTLTNQFGQKMSLRQFRGKVVLLAFIDSECTNVCPLTSVSMLQAQELLGAAGSKVALLAVNANPKATSVSDVMAFSRAHGMVNHWDFLTGPPAQLKSVWKKYNIAVEIQRGLIDHTPALLEIDPQGREQKIYLTQMAYDGLGQMAQLLAKEASRLLPGHPHLAKQESLAHIPGVKPTTTTTLKALPSGTVTLGPGHARLVMFFATWLTETSDLKKRLLGLDSYMQAARGGALPPLVAVDETASEPSVGRVRSFLASLGTPLSYPVGLDTTGRVADGYGVQDQPWFVLVSASGKIIWKHDSWLSVSALKSAVAHATGSG